MTRFPEASEREASDPKDGASISRRDLLRVAAGATVGFALTGCSPDIRTDQNEAPDEISDPLYYSSALALAGAIRERRLTSQEVVSACLDRITQVNPSLNAVVQLRAEDAMRDAEAADALVARGDELPLLHGVPMTIKDSLDTSDMVSTGGVEGRASFVPDQDATVVRRLREAGAILLGKTNTPSLTLSFETDNEVYGRTSNPWNPDRTSGGSSGGAGAIIAAGGAPFDIGSDYGGSIRIPSHFNGIAGLKPTHGRVPRTGHVLPFGGTHDSFQQIGPLARWVGDLWPLFEIIVGPDNIDPAIVPMPMGHPSEVDLATLRVGFHTDNGVVTPTPDTQAVVRTSAAELEGVVAMVEEARPDGLDEFRSVVGPMMGADGGAQRRRLLSEYGNPTNPDAGGGLSGEALDLLFRDWYALRSRMTRFFGDYDVILCPVHARPAPPHGEMSGAEVYTSAYNMTGWPGAVVRAGTSDDGLPIGVQIVTAPAREDIAVAVAMVIEERLGGFSPPPL